MYKLDQILIRLHKQLPHLPSNGRMWLAENAWWMILIGVVLGGFGTIGTFATVSFVGALLAGFGGMFGAMVGGLAVIAVAISLVFSIVTIILLLLAIAPLKHMRGRGWRLVFYAVLVNALGVVLHFLVSGNIMGLIWNLAWLAVGMYFLYEMKKHYQAESVRPK